MPKIGTAILHLVCLAAAVGGGYLIAEWRGSTYALIGWALGERYSLVRWVAHKLQRGTRGN